MGYTGTEKSEKEQYALHADGRDEGLSKLDGDSPEAFARWLKERPRTGHPWEVCRGGNSTHIDCIVHQDAHGYPALDPDTAEDENWYHPSTKENVPITAAQWSDVEQIILELYPLMEPIPKNRREVKLPPGIEVMDGGDSTSLILTWSTEDGTRSIRYNPPNDRRIHTLIALLEELADPIGREIPRYAPPELSGFYMGQSGALFSKDYSFQFDRGPSVVYGEDAPYILRARFTPSGRKQEIWSDWAVSDEEWDAFTAFAEEIRLEEQPDGSSEKPACTLYYSDGKQQQKKLDQETAKQLRAYFTELALCLLDEQP